MVSDLPDEPSGAVAAERHAPFPRDLPPAHLRAATPPDLTVRGLLLDVDKFATHDGPGIRTAVYLKGCPLRCVWCHSPESQSPRRQLLSLARKCTGCGDCLAACPEGALRLVAGDGPSGVSVEWARCTECGACAEVCYPGALKMAGEWTTVGEVVAEVEKDLAFFEASGGGVTLTGGEVTLQPSFAYHFLAACRARGIHTAVETSGCGAWPVYEALAEVTDLFLYDVKLVDEERHRRLVGASNRTIRANLERLAGLGANIVVRVPCIPGLTDAEGDVRAAAELASALGLTAIHLLPYNAAAGAKYLWTGRPYGLSGLEPQSAERMEALASICRAFGLATQVGG